MTYYEWLLAYDLFPTNSLVASFSSKMNDDQKEKKLSKMWKTILSFYTRVKWRIKKKGKIKKLFFSGWNWQSLQIHVVLKFFLFIFSCRFPICFLFSNLNFAELFAVFEEWWLERGAKVGGGMKGSNDICEMFFLKLHENFFFNWCWFFFCLVLDCFVSGVSSPKLQIPSSS